MKVILKKGGKVVASGSSIKLLQEYAHLKGIWIKKAVASKSSELGGGTVTVYYNNGAKAVVPFASRNKLVKWLERANL